MKRVLLDLFTACGQGDWASNDGKQQLMGIGCANGPNDDNSEGGGWQYEMFEPIDSETQQNVLILRPFPLTGGEVSVSFYARPDGFAQESVLEFDYEFVNTDGPDENSRMSLRVLVHVDDATTEELLIDTNEEIGQTGTFSMNLGVVPPTSELVFSIFSDFFVAGQGVALYNARIVAPN